MDSSDALIRKDDEDSLSKKSLVVELLIPIFKRVFIFSTYHFPLHTLSYKDRDNLVNLTMGCL